MPHTPHVPRVSRREQSGKLRRRTILALCAFLLALCSAPFIARSDAFSATDSSRITRRSSISNNSSRFSWLADNSDIYSKILASRSALSLIPAAPFVDSTIVSWEFQSNTGSEISANGSWDSNITAPVTISRGSGLIATGLSGSFNSESFTVNGTFADSVANNDYLQFSMTAQTGFRISLSTLDANFRRTSTGPSKFQWQYSLDGFSTVGFNIGSEISFTDTATNGIAQTQISLAGLSGLQNVDSSKTITIRLYGYGATNSGGGFAIGRLSGNDLALGGQVAAVAALPYFRTATSGDWQFNSTWETSTDGINWSAAASTPTSSTADTVTIRTGHAVTLSSVVSTDQTTVDSGGSLTVNPGMTLTVDDGFGADFIVNGTANVGGNGVIAGAGAFVLSSGATLGIGSANGITSGSTASGSIQVTGGRTFSTGANYSYISSSGQLTGNGLPATVNNLTISGSGGAVKSLGSPLTINGNFSMSSGATNGVEFNANSNTVTFRGNWDNTNGIYSGSTSPTNFGGTTTLTVNTANNTFGDVTIALGATLNASAATIRVAGNWLDNSTVGGASGHSGFFTQFTPGGAVTRTIGGTVASPAFNRFEVQATSGAIVKADKGLDIDGIFVLGSGTFDDGGFTHTIHRHWWKTAGTTYTATGTLIFDGSFSSDIEASNFHNITFNKASAATPVTLQGDVSVTGNWSNTSSSFNANGRTATFNGSGNTQTISGTNTFANLTVNHSGAGSVTAAGSALTVSGLLHVQSGIFTSATQYANVQIDSGAELSLSGPVSVSGNWTNNGTFTHNGHTVTFNGSSNQAISGSSTTQFASLTDANSSGTLSSSVNFNVSGTMTLNAGSVMSLDVAAQINSAGNVGTITGAGEAQVARLGSNSFSQQYRFFTFSTAGLTVNWAGAGDQLVENGVPGYGSIKTSGSGTKTMGGGVTLPITNNVEIGSGTTLAIGANNLNVGGNWSNSGAFGAGTSNITFNGATGQTVSGNTSFYNLTKSVSSPQQFNFAAGSTTTVSNSLTLTGAAGNLLTLRSTSTGNQWNLSAPATQSVDYVDVKDSNASGGNEVIATNSVNSGNNVNWNFGGNAISGTVYNDKGTTNIGAGKTIKLFVNGGSSTTTTTDASGQYSFSSVSFNAGDVLTVFISGATEKGATVTLAPNPVADITGLDIYRDSLIVRHENAGPITNANLDTGDPGGPDLNAIYSVSGGALTVAAGKELRIIAGEIFSPSGNVTTTDLFNAGTFSPGSATVNIGGVFTNSGTFNKGTSNVNYNQQSDGQNVLALDYAALTFSNFNKTLASSGIIGITNLFSPGTATGHTVTGSTIEYHIPGGGTTILPPLFVHYHNLTANSAGTLIGPTGLVVDATLQVMLGTFTSASDYHDVLIDSGATLSLSNPITVSGNWTNNGIFVPNGHTVTFDGAGAQTISTGGITADKDFAGFTVNKASGAATLAGDLSATALNITAGTFDQGASFSVTTSGTGTVATVGSSGTWTNFGTGDLTLSGNVSNSGLINFNGNGTACNEVATNDIVIASTGGQRTWSGSGTFSMTDVSVSNQRSAAPLPPLTILVNSGTDGPPTGTNTGWTFIDQCTSGTYTWIGGTVGLNTDWQVGTNWNPTRAAPAAGDILIFDGNSTPAPTVTNVPSQTIAQLLFKNGVTVNLSTSAPNTLTITGATGFDLDIADDSQVTLSGGNALKISLGAGATGNIDQLMVFTGGAHRLIAADASAVTITTGSIFTTATGFAGNAFGTGGAGDGAAGSIVFQSGSSYFHNAGSSPFGSSANPAVVVFQTGSLATFLTASGFEASNRTYADLAIGQTDPGGVDVDINTSGTDDFQFDNLSINSPGSSTSTFTHTGSESSVIRIKGNITSNGNPSSTSPDVSLKGGAGIEIDKTGGGTVTFGNDGNNTRGIDFESNATVLGGTTLVLNRVLRMGADQSNAKTLQVNANNGLTGGASGYVIGNLKRFLSLSSGATAVSYPVGTANGYSRVEETITVSSAGVYNQTIRAVQGKHPNISGANALGRYWVLTGISGPDSATANVTFYYLGGDVTGTESNYKFFRYDGSFHQLEPDDLDTTNHDATKNNVSTFSDWTLAEPAAVEEGTLQFVGAPYTDSETNADHPKTITVSRTGGSDGAVSVQWATSANTATAGTDYIEGSGVLNWADGEGGDQTFTVTVKGDTDYEAAETVNLTLSAATGGATIGTPNPATLTIINDDNPPTTLVVNTTDDVDDGFCSPTHTSLREAINCANFSSDPSTINFAIPADPGCNLGTGVCTITPGSPLPTITQPVVIDGYTQTGAAPNTLAQGDDAVLKIELDGTSAGAGARGLSLAGGSDGSTIRGLVINRFGGEGIFIASSNNVIAGNFIGTDVPGTNDLGNTLDGIYIDGGSGNTIGGTMAAARNLISGNDQYGIQVYNYSAQNNVIQGNYIGTNAAGTAAIGNSNYAVFLFLSSNGTVGGTATGAGNVISGNFSNALQSHADGNGNGGANNVIQGNFIGVAATGAAPLGNSGTGINLSGVDNNVVGGTTAAARNVISNNGTWGVRIEGFHASGNLIQGNSIGTDTAGTQNWGNGYAGVYVWRDSNNTIGGTGAGEGNLIAYNGTALGPLPKGGVLVEYSTANGGNGYNITIRGNSIFNNTGLGINLLGGTEDASGVTANDAGDSDTGANNLQNFPVITSAPVGGTTVSGTLDSYPGGTFNIDIYSNAACDPSGYGEGQTSLGSAAAVEGSPGQYTFSVSVPTVTSGQILTATATDANGNTSEFSLCFNTNTPPTINAAVGLTRQKGSPETNSQIATVDDTESGTNGVTVTIDGGASATVNGVTVSNIINTNGTVTADIVADCSATPPNASFTLTATDGGGATATDTLTIAITANTPPTLTYSSPQTVTEGNSLTISPATGPSDNGTISTIVVNSPGTYTGGISVDNSSGVVTITNAAPVGNHTITIRATDNCGAETDAQFTLDVNAAVCTTPPAGMVGWWPGDGNPHDIQGPTFENGTLQNGATFGAGKVNQAFSFDGSDDYVSVPDSTAWDFTGDFSIDLWVKFNTIKDTMLIHQESGGWEFDFQPSVGLVFARDPGASAIIRPWDPAANRWYHLAVTRTGTTYRLYVNGAQLGADEIDANPITNVTGDLRIGGYATNPAFQLDGLLDEIEIFNAALSAPDILAIYNASFAGKCRECTTPPTGMVSWWPFDETSGTSAADIAGPNNLTVSGAMFTAGKVGNALDFNGSSDNAQVPSSASLNSTTNALSVDAWVYWRGHSADNVDRIHAKRAAFGASHQLVIVNGTLHFGVNIGTGGNNASSPAPFPTGRWVHVTGTYDSSTVRLFIDGVEVASQPVTGPIQFDTGDLAVGWFNATLGEHWNGLIDELEIFNRALSPTEVAAIANAGNAGKCHTSAVTVGVDPASVTEDGAGNLVFTFSRSGDITTAVTVNFSIGGTASFSGNDYSQAGATTYDSPTGEGTLAFLANEGTKTVTIDPTPDTTVEPDETVVLTVTSGTGYEVGIPTTATGTISNDDATLTLVKTVINDNGGNKVVSDFPLFIDGNPLTSGTPITVSANAVHTATETTQTGYAPSAWGTDCNADGTITLQPGDNKTCTITNDDIAPTLTLVKTVINDSGGSKVVSDFPLFIDGNPVTSGTPNTLTANVLYTATETAQTGYAPSAWGGDCVADGTITLQPGDNKTCTITNDDVVPTISIDDVTHPEGDTGTVDYDFTVSLSYSSTQTITVDYATADDTAVAPGDYTGVTTTQLTFNPGETSKPVKVVANTDTVYELDEDFVVNLSSPVNATIGDGEGRGTITNDDAKPELSINDRNNFEGTIPTPTPTPTPSLTTTMTFTVSKTGSTAVNATVHFETSSTGATNPATAGAACVEGSGVDYVAQSGDLTFPPSGTGSTSQTITIVICKDPDFEPTENFFINLSAETNATLIKAQGVGTIKNDDIPTGGFVVTTTDDLDDGTCAAAPGHCSLREAINAANNAPGAVAISFNIPADDNLNPGGPRHFYYQDDNSGAGANGTLGTVAITTQANDSNNLDIDPDWPHSWWSILPTSQLPNISQQVFIQGYSQTGATENTLTTAATNAVLRIELNGESVSIPNANGLVLTGSGSTVSGLVVNRFQRDSLAVTPAGIGLELRGSGHDIAGCFIGTDVSGTVDRGNGGSGISLAIGGAHTVGGTTALTSTPEVVNLISGNDGGGIAVSSVSNIIQGNLIGTKANGISGLANSGAGISFSGAGFNTVGVDADPDTNSGEGNTIAFNTGDGVFVVSGVGNSIRGNSIHSNGTAAGHLGIELGADGVTANDTGDVDTGTNNLQNFPVIRAALADTLNRIRGTLNSTPDQTYTIDVYANVACDDSGNGEGKTYLGSTTADTGANGDALWSLNPATLNAGEFITATATDSSGNTSEFSACFQATGLNAGTVQFVSAPYTASETNVDHDVIITVSRTGGSNLAVDVTYATSDGTATAGEDYVAASGTLHWNNGETGNKTFTITVKGDTVFERDETVNITLSNPTNGATISGTNPTTLTITNDDPCPTTFTVNNNGDESDADPGDGIAETAVGVTTLRAAIEEANALTVCGTIDINFSVTGAIDLATALPAINHNVNINGPGANLLTVRRSMEVGTPNFRIFTIGSGTAVSISGLTLSGGKLSSDDGGGIFNNGSTLIIANSLLSNNSSSNAGGITNNNGGTLSISNSTLSNNSCTLSGGAIRNNGGTVTVINSTLANNSSINGGGIANNGGTVTITNSTLSNNSSSSGGGGAIVVDSGTANITNSTITGNSAAIGGGIRNFGTVNVKNSIVANSLSGGNCGNLGTLNASGANLSSDASCSGFTEVTSAQLNLGPLANNGGPTQTHLPLPGSSAINSGSDVTTLNGAIDNSTTTVVVTDGASIPAGVGFLIQIDNEQMSVTSKLGNTLTVVRGANSTTAAVHNNDAAVNPAFDQRGVGFPRVVNTTVDIGAVEVNYAITTTDGSGQSAQINTAFGIQLKATVTESGNPVSGIPVTFTAPLSGASATFSTGATVNTDANGVATVTATANGTANDPQNDPQNVPYTVTASLAGGSPSTNFALTNLKGNQTITVDTHAPANAAFNSNFTVAATSSSGLAVTYSSSGSCTNVGSMFTMISGAGVCTVKYDQPGNENYHAAAPQVTESVTAQKATATVTLSNLTQFYDGTAKFVTASTTPAGLNLTITYSQSGSPVASPTDYGAYAVSATIDDANYQGSADGTLAIVPRLYVDINNRVVAIDSVTFAAEPFSIGGEHNFSTDNLTRIMIFTSNLGVTSPPSDLSVQVGAIPLTIEGVGALPGTPDISYIIVKLENQPGLIGDVMLSVTYRGVTSNLGAITISP